MKRSLFPKERLGPLAVTLFLAGGIAGKTNFMGIHVPSNAHIGLTALSISIIFMAHFFSSKTESEISTPILQRARIAVIFLIVGGGFSCMLRVHFILNLFFWIIWANNFVAIWWSLPFLVKTLKSDQILELILKINGFFIFLMTLLHPILPYYQGRLGGIFAEATTTGRLSSLTCTLCFAHFFSIRPTGRRVAALFVASLTILMLSRTRASILAFAIASTFIGFFSLWSHRRWVRNRAQYCLFFVVMFLLFLWPSGAFEDDVRGPVLEYFRIGEDLGESYASARGMNWEQAIRDMEKYGFFGMGFLVKFGVTDFMVGTKPPKYDWLNSNDPLNMVLTLAKQAGWFTATAFICLLLILLDAARRLVDPVARLSILGVMISGLVFGLIDGNWLITFGEPNDRLSMIVLALMASRKDTSHNSKKY